MSRKLLALVTSAWLPVSLFVATPVNAAAKTYNLTFAVTSSGWHSLADNEAEAKLPSKCYPGQYSRLNAGAVLKITNQNGKLLAIGKTVWKVLDVTDQGEEYDSVRYEGLCALFTSVKKLQKASIYQFTLGTVDAGAFTFEELVSNKWQVLLTYG